MSRDWENGFTAGAAIGWGVGILFGLLFPEILQWLA